MDEANRNSELGQPVKITAFTIMPFDITLAMNFFVNSRFVIITGK